MALATFAATVALAAAPTVKARGNGERVLDVIRRDDGTEAARFVRLADGGVVMRYPDGGFAVVEVRSSGCTSDESAFEPLRRGCKRASDCDTYEPHLPSVSACVAVTNKAMESGAFSRALDKVASSIRGEDGGVCPISHVNSRAVGGCAAACVKGVCVEKHETFE